MKRENAKINGDVITYGVTEEPVVKFLENPLHCIEEEYNVEIFLDDAEGHLCIDYDKVEEEERQSVKEIMEALIPALLSHGQKQYIEQQLMKKRPRMKDDALTGLFTGKYLINRADILKRAEIYPTTVIAFKLKSWKSVNDNYGKESGDSLIQLTTSIIAKAADKDFLIGRMEEDIFVVLVPLAKEGEEEKYCSNVIETCAAYTDSLFEPKLEIAITVAQTKGEDINERIREAIAKLVN